MNEPNVTKDVIRAYQSNLRNHDNCIKIGSLVTPKNLSTTEKWGCLIVLNYIDKGQKHYILFSQKQQKEVTMLAWIVNHFMNISSE